HRQSVMLHFLDDSQDSYVYA
ncbi:hypothetical protein LB504_007440, partial [Fusarium proliferatum]